MKNYIANISSSFLPSIARKELLSFLITRTDLKKEIILKLALKHVAELHTFTDNENEPTENEIKEYIFNNHELLEKECTEILKKLVSKILPGFDWSVILKHIGLFAMFVFPVIGYLVTDLVDKINAQTPLPSMEIIGVLSLIILIIIAGTALILSGFTRKD